MRDPVRDKLTFSFEDLGEVAAKNIARPIHVFRVRHDTEATRPRQAPPRVKRRLVIAAALAPGVVRCWRGDVVLARTHAGQVRRRRCRWSCCRSTISVVVPTDDYLVAGVTDDLTTACRTFRAPSSSREPPRICTVARRRTSGELGMTLVSATSSEEACDGSGLTLRVNVELSSTETGAQLWSDSFDQKVADLASGQEQIVIRMRAALNVSLVDTEAARSLQERPTNPDAFDFILRARAVLLLPPTKDTMAQAVGLFQQALSRTRTRSWLWSERWGQL